jgi:hypothetical protein
MGGGDPPIAVAAARVRVTLALFVTCAACTRPSASAPDASASYVDPVQVAACGDRTSCRLESQHAELRTGDGSRSIVAIVSLGRAEANPHPPLRANWLLMDRDRGDLACNLRELWLLRSNEHATERVQLLASDCTRDIHEQPPEVVDVSPGRVRYIPEPSDGLHSLDFMLDPPALMLETHVSGGRTFTWIWPRFRGQVCAGGVCVPGLPDVDLDENFARGEWKTTSLGECSMLVDGAPAETSQGFASGGKATAAMRLLLSGETLYVEVTDDVFVTDGKVVDTLDIGSWVTYAMPAERTGYQEHQRLRMDGQLIDDAGKNRKVDVAIGPGTRRFALPGRWVKNPGEWEVTYEDTDDGRTYASKLSTGPHEMPPPLFWAPGACVAEGPSLRFVPAQAKDPRAPLIP